MSIIGLPLAGWGRLSTWGWDPPAQSFYAQLTRDGGSDEHGPEIWVTPGPRYPVIIELAQLITIVSRETGATFDEVDQALGEGLRYMGVDDGASVADVLYS